MNYRLLKRGFLSLCCLLGFSQLSALAYNIGDQVQVTGSFNVRTTPAGTVAGGQTLGSRGTVVGGPTVASLGGTPFTWWNIDFDTGTDGWIADTGLTTAWAIGADVYSGNSTINWATVKQQGISFVFAKASEGATFTDPKYVTNMNGGKAAGILMGSYHFAHPLNNTGTNGAVAEAQHFLSIAKPFITNGWLPPVLDVEDEPNGTDPTDPCSDGTSGGKTSINLVCKLGKTQLSAWVRTWVNEVKRQTGVTPILYMNRASATNGMDADLAVCPLWLAYFKNPPDIAQLPYAPWSNSWTFLQYSFTNILSGVSQGTVDYNLYSGDVRALQLFATQTATTNVILPRISGIGGNPLLSPTNGQFALEVSSATQAQVVVQSGTNLLSWTNAGTVALFHSHGTFTDTNVAGGGKKFYRPHP